MSEKKKTALWGYGLTGKDIRKIIETQLADEYVITAVFDRDFDRINREEDNDITVLDPALVPEYYKKGVFSSVIPCVIKKYQMVEIESYLHEVSVPISIPDNRSLLTPCSFFKEKRSDSLPRVKGYTVRALDGMYFSMMPHLHYQYISDREGRINSAYWRDYFSYSVPLCTCFFPSGDKNSVFLEGEWCVPGNMVNRNYWHFLFETMDQVYMLEKAGFKGKYILPETDFSGEMLSLIGVGPERVIYTDRMDFEKTYALETLITIELDHHDRRFAAPVLLDMAREMVRKIPEDGRKYPEKLYIERTGIRRLILPHGFTVKHGFTVIRPEELSVADQIRYFNNARIVLSPHGANSANSLFMKPGSVFIETFPRNYPNACCTETLYSSGVHFLMLTENHTEEELRPYDYERDYRILEQMLEMTVRNAEIIAGIS